MSYDISYGFYRTKIVEAYATSSNMFPGLNLCGPRSALYINVICHNAIPERLRSEAVNKSNIV